VDPGFNFNTSAIDDVIRLIEGRGLLPRDVRPPDWLGIKPIYSVEDILDEYREPQLDVEGHRNWRDLRIFQLHVFYDFRRETGIDRHQYALDMEAIDNKLSPLMEEQLVGRLPEDFVFEIIEDLNMIRRFRGVLGETPHMMNTLFMMYRSGGYPCGWDGNFPGGKMVVYYSRTL